MPGTQRVASQVATKLLVQTEIARVALRPEGLAGVDLSAAHLAASSG